MHTSQGVYVTVCVSVCVDRVFSSDEGTGVRSSQ